ncbi:hypothetical protein FJTKL_05143 [Diaporthe vaccinii]|uniref:HOOK N-terminal domain-containing protein n=1 Tax=Diaporthe vaccinii TaxID=105482 RepID=A0ABR4FEQ2_9PEZI
MPLGPAAQGALLKWVNAFADEGQSAQSIDDLADGFVLGQVLHGLDPTYDTSELDENMGSSKWLTQKRNLQSVYKGLFKYMRREAPDCLPLAQVADFRAVAEKPEADGLAQLAAVLLATAAMGPNKTIQARAITKVQTDLDAVEQNEIRRILEQKQKQMKELAAKAKEEEAAGDRDADLEHEEQIAKLESNLEQKVHELDLATKKYADLNSRHNYLQENHVEIKAKLAEVETELEDLRKLHGADESQRVQVLQSKIEEQSALIASQEEELENFKRTQQRLEVDLERYRASSEEGQEYKDKYDELRHQTQELEKKANAADRYKQKLADNRKFEKEIAGLKFELDSRKTLEEQLKRAQFERDRLQTSERETIATMTTIEQDINAERDQKEQYKLLYEEVRTEYEQLRLQNAVIEKYMEDLKEQLAGTGEVPRAPSPASQTGESSNLERELQQTTNDFSKVKLLEAEIEVLKHGAAAGSQVDDLRRELDRAKAERDIATSKYTSILEKHGVAQEQIDALIANMSGEGLVNGIDEALKFGPLGTLTSDYNRHVAYNSMRQQLAQATTEVNELKVRIRKLEEQAKDKDRENLSMKTDLDAVGSDRLDALERLKQSDQLIAASLRSELDAMREKYNNLEIENNLHKSQLLDALVAKEKLSKERDLEGPPANVAPEGVSQVDLDDRVKDYKSKTEKLRDRVKLQKEQLEKADQERFELQKQLKALESGSALAAQKAAHEQIIKNLQRENAMISTAWYDLTSRLQSNHVVLQRKDQPKSWLNKQRQMVNATPRR